MGRTHYYSHIFIAPDNENDAYFLTVGYSISLDGAQTLVQQQGSRAPGGDHHDMWIDPRDANRMIVGHDQGFSVSANRGRTIRMILHGSAEGDNGCGFLYALRSE